MTYARKLSSPISKTLPCRLEMAKKWKANQMGGGGKGLHARMSFFNISGYNFDYQTSGMNY